MSYSKFPDSSKLGKKGSRDHRNEDDVGKIVTIQHPRSYPVYRLSRTKVSTLEVWNEYQSGESIETICRDIFTRLLREDVIAALRWESKNPTLAKNRLPEDRPIP